MRVARCAGIQLVAADARISTTVTPANVTASIGCTPNSQLWIACAVSAAAGRRSRAHDRGHEAGARAQAHDVAAADRVRPGLIGSDRGRLVEQSECQHTQRTLRPFVRDLGGWENSPAPLVCGRATRVTGSGTDPIGPDPTRSDLPASKLIDVNDGRRPQGPGASPDGPSGLARQDSMTRTDEELVARSIGGDVDSFNQLVLRWERPIYALAYRVIGREEEARDVVQETFLRAFRGIKNFRGQAKFSSWVYRIALNLCRDWIRRERRAPIQAAPEGVDLVELAAEQGPVESIETLVARNDMSQAVAVAMARLPEEQRTAIILKEYHGMTFQEIADLQGCPLSTVKTRLYQGLSVLRRHLQQQGKYDPTTTTVP